MAEIRIEEKPRGSKSLWGWIVGLIAVGLLIWFLAEIFDRDDADEIGDDDTEMMDDRDDYANDEDTTALPER